MTIHYDSTRHAYVDENGKEVDQSRIRELILLGLASFVDQLRADTLLLVEGEITLDIWENQVRADIEGLHSAMFNAAVGAQESVTPALAARLESTLATQESYFNNLVEEIQTGAQAIDQTLVARTALYGQSGFSTFENARRALAEEVATAGNHAEALGIFGPAASEGPGTAQEIRILEPGANHCEDCLSVAGAWMPIGTLPDIGDSICTVNCLCNFEYRII